MRLLTAEVVLHGDNFNDTIAKVSEIVEMEGRGFFIPPYDDPKVIAGQGTIGLEIMEDLYDVDNVIVPIGGGGLIAGIAVAIQSLGPNHPCYWRTVLKTFTAWPAIFPLRRNHHAPNYRHPGGWL